MSKLPPAPALEHPGLAAAYATETAAVQMIATLKTRKHEAAAAIETARAERDGLATRAAKGEAVTGADLRRATEAVSEAEAGLQLASDALPVSVKHAFEAARDRAEAEREIVDAAHRPYKDALAAAEAALHAAQTAHAKAKTEAERLPAEARGALEDLLDRHGRDESAAAKIAELRRLRDVNRQRSAQGLPLVDWP